jgi:aminopeptidase-like protein
MTSVLKHPVQTSDTVHGLQPEEAGLLGQAMWDLVRELYPICRSITGNGVRETLRKIGSLIPLAVHEVPTGTPVFDWTIPNEWNIKDAFIRNSKGGRIVDFRNSNLHVLNYSLPIRKTLPLAELLPHLYSLPQHPDWIPYRTSYYEENWGFCLSHHQLLTITDAEYEVCIDSTLEPGHLIYGEYWIEGRTPDEVLLSTHACHPSLCNDNLSGIALATYLARHLTGRRLRYSYRFLFIPGTIGSIAWLSRNEEKTSRIKHGLVIACVGDPGKLTYKKSRRGNAEIDRAVIHVLNHSGKEYEIIDFSPYGYDERQYCSPGFDLPVGSLTRTPHGRYPEYHTSADNLGLVKPDCLADSLSKYLSVISVLEDNGTYLNKNPKCEPQLGKRGLYRALGGDADAGKNEMAMLWVLNLSDGSNTLLDIAERSSLPFERIRHVARELEKHNLLEKCIE